MVAKTAAGSSDVLFRLDCSTPVGDKVMEAATLADYLKARIKVAGKAGNLGDRVVVEATRTHVQVSANLALSKKYLKYLTKKARPREREGAAPRPAPHLHHRLRLLLLLLLLLLPSRENVRRRERSTSAPRLRFRT